MGGVTKEPGKSVVCVVYLGVGDRREQRLPGHAVTLHTQTSLHTRHQTLVQGAKMQALLVCRRSSVLGFCGVLESLDNRFDN